MADFISQLRPASFRGYPFLVPSDSSSFGRRVVVHEYPGRDTPSHEDLGASPDEFSIEAIIAGNDFFSDAAAFEAALRQKGAGTLVHPYYGSLNVIVMPPVRVDRSLEAVGEVRFSINVQKFGDLIYPLALADTVAALTSASDSLFSSIASDFNNRFSIDGLQDFLVDDAAERVLSLSSSINGLMSKSGLIATAKKFLPSSWNVATNLAEQVIGMFSGIAGVTKPKQKAVIGSSTVSTSSIPARAVLNVMSAATLISSGEATGRSVRIANAQAIDYLFRASALASAASVAKYATYDSREDAIAVRNNLASNIETLRNDLGAAGYDKSWSDSGMVLAAVTKDINERLGRLPKTVKIRPSSPRSSLALANRLYGDDVDRLFKSAEEIVARNKVRHPGVVPVQTLEVLVNA